MHIGVKKCSSGAAVFVDFPKNKCNFLHKNKLDIVRRVQLLTRRHPMRSFSAGAVASIALWKSAPVIDWYAMILMCLINMSTQDIWHHSHCLKSDIICTKASWAAAAVVHSACVDGPGRGTSHWLQDCSHLLASRHYLRWLECESIRFFWLCNGLYFTV